MASVPDPRVGQIDELEAAALECMRRGDERGALQIWEQLCTLQPTHAVALTQTGQAAFKRGAFTLALERFQQAAAANGTRPRAWINIALAAQQLGDASVEAKALQAALERDPYDLTALYLRGLMHERAGREGQAAASFGAMLTVASQQPSVPREYQAAIQHAREAQQRYGERLAASVDGALAPMLETLPAEQVDRFRDSVDILLGRKRRYDAQPMRYFFPRLPAIEFFDRALFPWLDAIEASTHAVRSEFEAVLAEGEEGFSPYIQYGTDQPVAQWRELNHNPAWSAFHLVKDGIEVASNAVRCPRTMALWRTTPYPVQAGRTPVALFSALHPRTHIPAHVGASNCRLLVHLPLIVPRGCRLRVGNQVREWVPGRCLVFDDSIEHEAWNDSGELRVVLIFDTWHPMLSDVERRLITQLNLALNEFSAALGEYGA